MPEVKAKAKYIRMSPRKVRAVADVVRGMKAEEALRQLEFIPAKAAKPISKLLGSAVANAENNSLLETKSLQIKSLTVDGGPTLKRYRPRAYGRATPIKRRTSHISVILEGEKMNPEQKKRLEQKKKDIPRSEQKPPQESEVAKEKQQEFGVEKKVGQEQKKSFVKKIFRRKSI